MRFWRWLLNSLAIVSASAVIVAAVGHFSEKTRIISAGFGLLMLAVLYLIPNRDQDS